MGNKVLSPYLARIEFSCKWAGTMLIVLSTYCTAIDIIPLNKVLLLAGSLSWLIVGIIWQQPSVWILNIYAVIILTYGLLML